jgi:hypothetical protein
MERRSDVASLTVYSSAADGRIESNHATYSTARSGANLGAALTNSNEYIGQKGGYYYLSEAFFDFDTSALVAGDTVTAAVFSLYCSDRWENEEAHIQELYSEAWTTPLTAADWVAGADVSALTKVATFDTVGGTGITGSEYKAFSSEAAMTAAIVKGGTTKFMLTTDQFRLGSAPSSAERIEWAFYEAGSGYRPKLVITYTEAAAGRSHRLMMMGAGS